MSIPNSSITMLAAKVDELAQVCTRLSEENAELRERLSRLPEEKTQATEQLADNPRAVQNPTQDARGRAAGQRPLDGTVSRRTVGKALGAAAAGVVGAAALVDLGSRAAAADAISGDIAPARHGIKASDSPAPSVVQATLSSTGGVVVADNTGSGSGVQATGTRGGTFAGSAAQVQLTPGSMSTHPTSGDRGDLYADSTGRLWFCTKTGSTASWHQLT
jgi:hypothetical protein